MMDAYDPQLAPVRCWEHEDCIDHPELGVVCATGQPTFCQVGTAGHWTMLTVAWSRGGERWADYIGGDDPLQAHSSEDDSYGGYGDGYRYGNAYGDGRGSGDYHEEGYSHGFIQESLRT